MSYAGRLRHQVTLQNYTISQGDFGEETKAWTDLATVRAAIEPLRGKELFQSQQRYATLSTRIIIRYISGVDEKTRVKFGSRFFSLVAPPINKEERGRWLELMCEEGEQDG